MSEIRPLIDAIPSWLALCRISAPNLGLERYEARARAVDLLGRLERGDAGNPGLNVTAEDIDTLHAAVELLSEEVDFSRRCARGYPLLLHARALVWPDPLGEREGLLHSIGSLLRRPVTARGREAALIALQSPPEQRIAPSRDINLEDPDMLASLVHALTGQVDAEPASNRFEAEFFYQFLASPARSIGILDEREYFLGELALLAGGACRFLLRKDEARRWFDRAEAHFQSTVRAQAECFRVVYQRLALRLEERAYEDIQELTPPLRESFLRLGMTADARKCRFLEGIAHQELGDVSKAMEVFEDVSKEAAVARDRRLYGLAEGNLFMLHANLGDKERALLSSGRALDVLAELGLRPHLAKLQWNLGNLYRSLERTELAIGAYRAALEDFREIGMRGDVVSMHLVIAELLLGQGAEAEAELEIRAALPIIEQEKMVPEGMAAYALLRESVRRRKIDRNALRDVHGYFQK